MRPKEQSDTGQQDLFRARLDQIVDREHPLVKLTKTIDWGFLAERFGVVYSDGPGQPPLPIRLMAGFATCTISPTRGCAGAGLRTHITNSSAARSFSATGCRSIASR